MWSGVTAIDHLGFVSCIPDKTPLFPWDIIKQYDFVRIKLIENDRKRSARTKKATPG